MPKTTLDGCRLRPTRFFLNCNDGISPAQVKSIVKKYGEDVLIGIDPGLTDRPSDEGLETIKAIKDNGARLHVYSVGPGMWSWSADERAQIKLLADSIGIDTSESGWKDEWYETGWEKKAFEQFEYYHKEHEAYSIEIDNLDSSTMKTDFKKYVTFYKRFSEKLLDADIMTKLMLKNIDEDGLQLIKDSIKNGEIDPLFFAPWGMFEQGTGDASEQIKVCKSFDIYAVTPDSGITDTNHYGVVAKGVPTW